MLIALLIIEFICLFCVCAVALHLYHKHARLSRAKAGLEEMLSSAPDGFFCSFGQDEDICSRRLAILLGFNQTDVHFDDILKKLTSSSAEELKNAFEKLCTQTRAFSILVSTQGANMRLLVSGVNASLPDGTGASNIMWFHNVTNIMEENEQYARKLKALQERDYLLMEALDGFPFALWLRNNDSSLAFCNTAYVNLTESDSKANALKKNIELNYDAPNKMGAKLLSIAAKSSGEIKSETGIFKYKNKSHQMEVNEIPLGLEKDEKHRFTLGFVRDIQNEATLKTSLDKYLKAQYQVLGALSSGIVIFDGNGYVQFYNKAFCDLWKLPEEWLITSPSFAGILEKLREKRLLPEQGDFLKYKHQELEKFSTLSDVAEDILYLPNGHIYRRIMNPYPLGGVVMTFDNVSDKVSLERSYNKQLANQQSILNLLTEGLLIFNEEGRLKGYNTRYVELFEADENFLQSEPVLMDVLDSQKLCLAASDDIWELLKQKILLIFDDATEKVDLSLHEKSYCVKCSRLPDGGFLLFYELND